MGNCLKFCTSTPEDDMLLPDQHDEESPSPVSPNPTEEYSGDPVFYVSPNIGLPVSQLTEDEQIRIAKRIGYIQQLPTMLYDSSTKNKECAICMCDFNLKDTVRYLPCLHIYHSSCIDDWLMRSFTCPSCLEPVDAALLRPFLDR